MDVKYSGRGYTVHGSAFQCDVYVTGAPFVASAAAVGGTVQVDLNERNGMCNVMATGFNLDLANFVVYAEWQKRTTDEKLSQAFGDTEAYYATLGYRFGKWLPHLTFASVTGEASTVGLPADGVAEVLTGPAAGFQLNYPVPIQTSITAGLRYEVNDSAALKIEYMVVDVETDQQTLSDANEPGNFNYGLFNTNFDQAGPQNQVGIMSVALDVIF